MMEEGFFRNKPADYLWLLLFSGIALIACSVSISRKEKPEKEKAGAFLLML